jgi:hypothetical protein
VQYEKLFFQLFDLYTVDWLSLNGSCLVYLTIGQMEFL